MSPTNQQRALIALVQVLGLSVWFSATAVVPSLRSEWGIGSTAAVWLTASVQIGFVAGAVISALLNLADRIRPEYLLAASALCAATCTAALALSVNGIHAAIPLRFLTGMFLAGVYPVGMKLMASWSGSAERGRSFGILLGALTLGSALPHLIGGLGPLPWRTVMLTARRWRPSQPSSPSRSLRPGPHLQIRAITPNPRHAMVVFTERGHGWRASVTSGTCGSSTRCGPGCRCSFVPGEDATRRRRRRSSSRSSRSVSPGRPAVFWAVGIGPFRSLSRGGGGADDQRACCVASPIFFAASTVVLVVFLLVWGAAVIADSGVFSTVLSETTDTRFVGTALTAQTAIGFLLTVVSIQLVPVVADLIGWQYAFVLLAPGPLLGAVAMSARGARHTTHNPRRKAMTSCSTSPTPFVGQTRRAVTHHR